MWELGDQWEEQSPEERDDEAQEGQNEDSLAWMCVLMDKSPTSTNGDEKNAGNAVSALTVPVSRAEAEENEVPMQRRATRGG